MASVEIEILISAVVKNLAPDAPGQGYVIERIYIEKLHIQV
jgi:hypothetical protein